MLLSSNASSSMPSATSTRKLKQLLVFESEVIAKRKTADLLLMMSNTSQGSVAKAAMLLGWAAVRNDSEAMVSLGWLLSSGYPFGM